ncbi:MAG: DUF434 domain-containing protein [Oscillospiraceae bacterium]|nr:DUF434 domain-containing protein [Oscillospiraceae bacterium]
MSNENMSNENMSNENMPNENMLNENMPKEGRIHTRGLEPDDNRMFGVEQTGKLKSAQLELSFLLDRGYPIKSAMAFVGNHHQLTSRQSLAVTRSTASTESLSVRTGKSITPDGVAGKTIYIDGFNQIITLEVALSDGMLFVGQDGCVRDLAELRGTYRLIPQTMTAIDIIKGVCSELNVSDVVIMLDEPVSNSGRLKTRVYDTYWPMPVDVVILRNPDAELKKLPCVVSSDSIVLDCCASWFNMAAYAFSSCKEFQKLSRLVRMDNR